MSTTIRRTELLASFQELQDKFSNTLDWAKGQESAFDGLREAFLADVDKQLKRARKQLKKTHPAHGQLSAFIGLMEATKGEWKIKVLDRKRGVAFQEDFGDSLLVFVNGKVKSGKSSLGNYMAWGHTDPTPELKRQVARENAPDYFSRDQTEVRGGDGKGEAQDRREFRVGAVEATSSIQGFRLPGLTWVDSPGLHSMNPENGKLALRYVDHADLILYTMKSDSPGRESDVSEIERLVGKDKKIVLLLTGSDDIEEEPAPDGETLVQTVVMKDAARCGRQVDYVREALEKACGPALAASVDIVPVSARYAQLHAGDPARLAESGMGTLFATLHRIAHSEGLKIKQRTPVANLYHFLQACHRDLGPYETLIAGFRQPLQEAKLRTDNRLNTVVHAAQAELQGFVDRYFERLEADRHGDGLATQLAAFQKALNGQMQETVKTHLADVFEQMMSGFATAIEDTYQASELVRLPDFEVQKVKEQIPRVQSGTRGRNSLIGSTLLGALGFFLGGPAGAGLGASIGGALGGATGNSASTSYSEIEVTVGDNLQEIRLQAVRQAQEALDTQIRGAAGALWRSVEEEVDGLLDPLAGTIRQFDTDLQALLRTIEDKQEAS